MAAPMVVPGAIAATWAEKVMIAPAEAARAPDGVTYTTTGTRAFRNAWLISRIEESSPPGVSSSTRKAACPSRWAARTPPASWSATTGVIGPATRVTSTVGACPAAAGAQASSQPNPTMAAASSSRTDRAWPDLSAPGWRELDVSMATSPGWSSVSVGVAAFPGLDARCVQPGTEQRPPGLPLRWPDGRRRWVRAGCVSPRWSRCQPAGAATRPAADQSARSFLLGTGNFDGARQR